MIWDSILTTAEEKRIEAVQRLRGAAALGGSNKKTRMDMIRMTITESGAGEGEVVPMILPEILLREEQTRLRVRRGVASTAFADSRRTMGVNVRGAEPMEGIARNGR